MADEQVARVKQANDIVEVIGTRIQLKKAGRNFKGLCPFHGEKSPSFFVSSEMQMYKCFGCGVSGDVLTFIQEYEGLSFPEALEQLADRAGIQLQKRAQSPLESHSEKLLEILHLAKEYYQYLLTEHKVGEVARVYLKERGVHVQSIKDFELGYAPDAWQGLWNYLVQKKHYDKELVIKTGLMVQSEKGRVYDRFRGRVMFPLTDFAGRVVGFSGRLLEADTKEAKYINTPETEIYHKGELLFCLSKQKRHIRTADRVIVVEGELDVISSVQAEVKEVVAVKGSALTAEQVLAIRRLTRNIVLALDADSAGQEAMKRGIEVAEAKAMNLRVLRLVGGKDPDEIARTNPKDWREMCKTTISIYQFYMDLAFEAHDAQTGLGQKQISQMMAEVLSQIENEVEKDFYVRKLSERLGVGKRVVEEEMVKVNRPQIKSEEGKREVRSMERQERLERYVIGVGLQTGSELKSCLLSLETGWFEEKYVQSLYDEIRGVLERKHQVTLVDLQEGVKEEYQPLLLELYGEDQDLLLHSREELVRIFTKAAEELQSRHRRRRLQELTREMAGITSDEPRLLQLREEYSKLKKVTITD